MTTNTNTMKLDDMQIEQFYTTPTGGAWTVDRLGFAQELSDKGKAVMRRTWEEEPTRRPLFTEEPPAEWATPANAASYQPPPDLDVPY